MSAISSVKRSSGAWRATIASASASPLVRPMLGARRVDDGFDRLGQRLSGAALVEHGEFRRHAGFEREAAQQRLAEGVDRRDLGAAGHVEDAREQLAGQGDVVLVGIAAGQLDQLHAPARQAASSSIWPAGR